MEDKVKKVRGKQQMTVRWAKFVDEYLKDANGTRAVVAAGYETTRPAERASKLLRNPLIKEAIDKARQVLQQKAPFTHEHAMAELQEIIDFSKNNKGVTNLPKLLDLKYKMLGLHSDRITLDVNRAPDLSEIRRKLAHANLRGGKHCPNCDAEYVQIVGNAGYYKEEKEVESAIIIESGLVGPAAEFPACEDVMKDGEK